MRHVKAKTRVLVVEDNSDLRRLYAIGLNQRGFEVKLAANGAEAIDRISTEAPDVVVLDLLMPIMSGWEVIDRINDSKRALPVPVIIISGQTEPDDRPRPPSVAAWLSKPITLEELVTTISSITS